MWITRTVEARLRKSARTRPVVVLIEVRMHGRDRPGPAARHPGDLDSGMAEEDAQRLTAHVPASADYADFHQRLLTPGTEDAGRPE